MNKLQLLSLLLILFIPCIIACGDGDDSDDPTPPVVNPDNPGGGGTTTFTLSLSSTSLNFENKGGQQTVTVTTNATSWSAQSNQSWCKVTQSGTTLSVTVDVNTDTNQRSAVITVSATGVSQSQSISVTQAAGSNDPYLIIGEYLTQVVFPYEGGSQTLDVQTNCDDWTIDYLPSNLLVFTVTKVSSSKVKIDVDQRPYNHPDPESSIISFKDKDGTTLAELKVIQDPIPVFDISSYQTVSPNGGTYKVWVEVSTSSLTAVTSASWIEVKEVVYDVRRCYVTIDVAPRQEGEQPRYALLEFTAHNVTAKMLIYDEDGQLPNPTIGGDGYTYDDPTPWD